MPEGLYKCSLCIVELWPRREAQNAEKCETLVDSGSRMLVSDGVGGMPEGLYKCSLCIMHCLMSTTASLLPGDSATATFIVARPDPRRLRRQPAARIIQRQYA